MRAQLLISGVDDPNMRYATGLEILDPFIWVRIVGKGRAKEFVIVSRLEYAKTKSQARRGTIVVLLDDVDMRGVKLQGSRPSLAEYAACFLRQHKITEAVVPQEFWSSHFVALRAQGITPSIVTPFFPQRLIKSPAEIAAIKRTGAVTIKAFKHAVGIIKRSAAGKDGVLRVDGATLTSERLKLEIERVFFEHGCASGQSIVACGAQAAQPHNYGSGPLRANEPIVIDIYPRDLSSGYFFDMTRTVIKGAPSPELRRLYAAVRQSQAAGVAAVRAGAKAGAVYDACAQVFVARKYESSLHEGFIHSAGHGLGLQIHEPPRLGPGNGEPLRAGMVVTVEPGLYYARIGGVRIEDTVVVTSKGCINLCRGAPKTFTIK